jgi:hypothetical protein
MMQRQSVLGLFSKIEKSLDEKETIHIIRAKGLVLSKYPGLAGNVWKSW